ncbi:MAG: bifunctional phosphoribosylaminoimidazolecarboxamide formyltransferase/IMP cyclohydrolase [Elusimicrobiota bacterium]
MNIAVFASGKGSNFKNLVELEKIGYLKGKIKLLITNKDVEALDIAKKHNIENEIISPLNFNDNKDYEIYLINKLKSKKIDLVVLAGYIKKLPEKFVTEYNGKIINIHPAILPSFGGKGFYGEKVHKAVLEKGVKISGITIHFVNSNYDEGPIILQKTIAITPNDNIETIQQKIHKLEYFYYPFVINMISDGIIELKENKVKIATKPSTSKHALISVSDKENIVNVAKKINEKGYLIISTGGTYKLLDENGLKVIPIDSITGFTEILDGRVKTLNNLIFGGILGIKNNPSHIKEMNENFIPNINIVIANLYPFKEASIKYESFSPQLIENIDIGGVSLIRASAKNYENVLIITDKSDYQKLINEIDNPAIEFRKELSVKAFKHTYEYDKMIYEKLSGKQNLSIEIKKILDLRYGENPHQKSSLYSLKEKMPFDQLWGKELSYNNILDAYGSWQAVCEFDKPACVIFKHATPCGIAINNDLNTAFEKAYNSDPLSAFGGIIAVNGKITSTMAKFLSDKFVEIISAWEFDQNALEILKKKKNLRLLKWNTDIRETKIYKSLGCEFLISDPDNKILGENWNIVNGEINEKEKEALVFAFTCVKHVRSNAIVLSGPDYTVGIGAGQMSRIDAVFMAEYKYREYLKTNKKPEILVMASDAFFPFPDSIIKAKEIGVSAIIQPGGSVKDDEVIEKAKELGIKMVLTGIRHFKH